MKNRWLIVSGYLCLLVIAMYIAYNTKPEKPPLGQREFSYQMILTKICAEDGHMYYSMWSDKVVPALDDNGKPIKCEYKKEQ